MIRFFTPGACMCIGARPFSRGTPGGLAARGGLCINDTYWGFRQSTAGHYCNTMLRVSLGIIGSGWCAHDFTHDFAHQLRH